MRYDSEITDALTDALAAIHKAGDAISEAGDREAERVLYKMTKTIMDLMVA